MITRHDIACMVQEIISECHSRPKGAEMIDLINKYAKKFGKDNSGMVPDEKELSLLFDMLKTHKVNYLPELLTQPTGIIGIDQAFSTFKIWLSKFSQQPPKEPIGIVGKKAWGILSQIERAKERKVSLEGKDICTCTRKYMKCNYHDVKLTEID